MEVFKIGRSRHQLVLEAAPLWYASTPQAPNMPTWPQISLYVVGHYVACAWCGEGCTALSIALVDSIVSSRVGAPHESNRCTPAQRIMHLRAVSARAPVATASRTPANLRYACRCTGVDLCVLAFALTVSSGHDGCGIRVFAVSSVRAAANCCAWMKGRHFVLLAKTPGHDLGRGHGCGRLDMWRRVLRFPQAVVRQLIRVIHASVHALCVAADGCETGACMFVSVARETCVRNQRSHCEPRLMSECVISVRSQ